MLTDDIVTIAELWRYPVKGMRGERLAALDLDAHGIAGDRRFGFRSSGAPRGKPLLTGAERAAMLLYTASGAGAETRVTGPDGETFRLDDPLLIDRLQDSLPGGHTLSLVRSETPLTDVRPVAMVGAGTLAQLAREFGAAVDPRRFRANILLICRQPLRRMDWQDGAWQLDRMPCCGLRNAFPAAASSRWTLKPPPQTPV